jgi:hypothetical protein
LFTIEAGPITGAIARGIGLSNQLGVSLSYNDIAAIISQIASVCCFFVSLFIYFILASLFSPSLLKNLKEDQPVLKWKCLILVFGICAECQGPTGR